MKYYNRGIVWAAACCIAVCMFVINIDQAVGSEMKIGYIDAKRAFDEFDKTKDETAELQKINYAKEIEGQKMVDEVNRLKGELQLLSDDAKEEKEKELKEKMRQLIAFNEDTKTELKKQHNETVKKLIDEVMMVVEEIGKAQGYTLIFNDQVLFYKSDANDVTDEVLEFLNKRYKKEKASAK